MRRKEYFKGNVHKGIILATKSLTGATNKQIASAMNISIRTLYNIKSGKNKSKETKGKFITFMRKAGTKRSIEIGVLTEHFQRTGKQKHLTEKETKNLLKKRKKRIDEITKKFEKDEKLLYKNLWY